MRVSGAGATPYQSAAVGPGAPQVTPLQAKTTEQFEKIKSRIADDTSISLGDPTSKLTLDKVRLSAEDAITKEKITDRKETRSLRVNQRLLLMQDFLERKCPDLTPAERNMLLREYKDKLKEGDVPEGSIKVKDAKSFFEHAMKEFPKLQDPAARSVFVKLQAMEMQGFLEKQYPNLTEPEVNLIVNEYKNRLQTGSTLGQVTDIKSFFQYVVTPKYITHEDAKLQSTFEKLKLPSSENIKKSLTAFFGEVDKDFVLRCSGAEKAVYLFEGMAVSTPKETKDLKVLEEEYAMTVDLRLNGMQRELAALGLPKASVSTIIKDYKAALNDQNNDVKDAKSFFDYYTRLPNKMTILEELMRRAGTKGTNITQISDKIDRDLSTIDVTRKRHVDPQGGRVYFIAEAAKEGDLKGFLSSKIDTLTPEQFDEFVKSFDEMGKSMEKAGLLHGDIKPDNILVYSSVGEDGKVKYSVKVSDFGKSQISDNLEKASQINQGNIRFNKGAKNTLETQRESLSMLKFLILNSHTAVTLDLVNPEHVSNPETLLPESPLRTTKEKISDIVSTSIGAYLYLAGNESGAAGKTNFFSNVNLPEKTEEAKSRAFRTFRLDAKQEARFNKFTTDMLAGEKETARIRGNTKEAIMGFLDASKKSYTLGSLQAMSSEERDQAKKELTQRLESYKILADPNMSAIYPTTPQEVGIIQAEIRRCTNTLTTLNRLPPPLSTTVPKEGPPAAATMPPPRTQARPGAPAMPSTVPPPRVPPPLPSSPPPPPSQTRSRSSLPETPQPSQQTASRTPPPPPASRPPPPPSTTPSQPPSLADALKAEQQRRGLTQPPQT